jgi:23S rRNA C2498 (ribose-2'-O)-methylase RlmM
MAQKQRADTLARDLEAQRQAHEAQLVAVRQELNRAQEDARVQPALQTAQKAVRPAEPKGKELVIPVEKAPLPGLQGAVTVKDRR